MKPEHEELFRGISGQAYCYLCSRPFETHLDCAVHLEEAHPEIWQKMVDVSESIQKLHEQMDVLEKEIREIHIEQTRPRIQKLVELQLAVNSLLSQIPRILEETHHVSSRN